MHYLCSENKGADQLRGYREADLRLCFRICEKPFSHNAAYFIPATSKFKLSSGTFYNKGMYSSKLSHVRRKPESLGFPTKSETICAFVFAYAKSRFSHYAAQFISTLLKAKMIKI